MNPTIVVISLVACCLLPKLTLGQNRMYGAQETRIEQYPFMAIIAFGSEVRGSGAILAPRWVVTSASVFYESPESHYSAIVGGSFLHAGSWYEAARAMKHPEFIGWDYNVGLLQTNKDIEYKSVVRPINIASSNPGRIDVTVLSYGRNEEGSSNLEEIRATLTSDEACLDYLMDPSAKGVIESGHGYCIIPPQGSGLKFWHNDAGAPAVANGELYALFASGGFSNNESNDYVATRLAAVKDWIDGNIQS